MKTFFKFVDFNVLCGRTTIDCDILELVIESYQMIIHGAFVIYQTFFSADACLLEVKVFLCMLLKYFATSLTQVFREKLLKCPHLRVI